MEWFKQRNYSSNERKRIKALVVERWKKGYQNTQSNAPIPPAPAVSPLFMVKIINLIYITETSGSMASDCYVGFNRSR